MRRAARQARLADGLQRGADGVVRCWWCGDAEDYVRYHDTEWGVPVRDDVRLFEKLSLEGFQAGLSWLTILRKRESFRAAFAGFDPLDVARFGARDVTRLLKDVGIVRHRGKIEAVINNARRYQPLCDEFGSLADFIWSYRPSPAPRGTERSRRDPGGDRRVHRDVQGAQDTRLEVRRAHHDVRALPGDGTRERSPRGMLPSRTSGSLRARLAPARSARALRDPERLRQQFPGVTAHLPVTQAERVHQRGELVGRRRALGEVRPHRR